MPSRFANYPAWAARLILASLLLISACGVILTTEWPETAEAAAIDRTDTDLALYQAIAARVASGAGYYPAAVAEQRIRDYPLRPAFTVRLPTLAWTIGMAGENTAALLLRVLMVAAIAALTLRLRSLAGSKLEWVAAAVLGAAGIALLTVPAMTFWHESWAALLIVLSVGLRSPRRWLASLLVGLLAVFFRELALPFLAVMAVQAWREGNKVEAASWIAAILIALLAVASHATILAQYVTDADTASPGWSGAGGWLFVLAMVQHCTLLLFLPPAMLALLVPLALLGWAGLRSPTGERVALLLLGYIAGFMLIGRPDNFYWGILIAPLLPVGLAFAPRAVRDLFRGIEFVNRGGLKMAG